MLSSLAGIQETVLLYQGERGRPRARRMLTEKDATQNVDDIFGLDAYAPAAEPDRELGTTDRRDTNRSQPGPALQRPGGGKCGYSGLAHLVGDCAGYASRPGGRRDVNDTSMACRVAGRVSAPGYSTHKPRSVVQPSSASAGSASVSRATSARSIPSATSLTATAAQPAAGSGIQGQRPPSAAHVFTREPTAPEANRESIASLVSPSSASTSRVCWP